MGPYNLLQNALFNIVPIIIMLTQHKENQPRLYAAGLLFAMITSSGMGLDEKRESHIGD